MLPPPPLPKTSTHPVLAFQFIPLITARWLILKGIIAKGPPRAFSPCLTLKDPTRVPAQNSIRYRCFLSFGRAPGTGSRLHVQACKASGSSPVHTPRMYSPPTLTVGPYSNTDEGRGMASMASSWSPITAGFVGMALLTDTFCFSASSAAFCFSCSFFLPKPNIP